MCNCRKSGRFIPSSVEFYNIKAVEAPEGGWTEENFRGRDGVRLLQSLIKVRRAAVARGIRNTTKIIREFQIKKLNEVLTAVERVESANTTKSFLDFDPNSHQALWARAIEDAFREADMQLRLEFLPSIQSIATEVHHKTSVLLGSEWSDITNQAIQSRVRGLALEVTRINDTTVRLLQDALRDVISGGGTVREAIDEIRARVPQIAQGRVPTIARTEMGRAADEGTKQALKDSTMVTHVSVIGCEAVEDNSPKYNGIPTCNIQNVPVEDVDQLQFHPNHTGAIIPSKFRRADGGSDRDVRTSRGDAGEEVE